MEPVGPRRPGAGSFAVHSHPARAAYSPHQRGEGLRGPSRLGVSLRHTGIRRQTHDIRRRRSAQRPLPRSLDRLHHGPRQEAGHLPRQTHRTQRTRGSHPRTSHRHRRADRPHAAHGLELVELLGARRHAGASPLLGSCDGRVGAREPRLDVHQHRRRLAGPARRPLQRHPDQRQVPRHEGALGAGTRHGT